MARQYRLLRSSQSGGDYAIYPWSIKFARVRVFAASRCGGNRTGCDLGPAAVLPTPTALVDIQFAVWTAGLMGDAVILIKRHLGNRAAESRSTGRYRAGRHFAATDRGEPARSGFCAAALGIFGHFSDSRAEQCIFPLLAFPRLLSSCSRRWQSSTKHGGREALLLAEWELYRVPSRSRCLTFGLVVALSSFPGALFWIMRPSSCDGNPYH
jgi:hypothetical protein